MSILRDKFREIKEYVNSRMQFAVLLSIHSSVLDSIKKSIASLSKSKQDKLKAGKNITINNNVISAEGGSNLTAGQNIDISNNSISAKGYVWVDGNQSFAEGNWVNGANGNYSHAEGDSTSANGFASHAEGDSTSANGFASHAEGDSTTASGDCSHAEGDSSYASGYASHSEGNITAATGNSAHAEGYVTTASGDYSHAEGYNSQATTSNYSSNTLSADSSTSNGFICHAEGNACIAQGYNSHAEGKKTFASGGVSHAEGSNTTASGSISHAEGQFTTAHGSVSHAEGQSTTASGFISHAEGSGTIASGDYSHAEGQDTYAEGSSSHAEGQSTAASGEQSHAEGYAANSSGDFSHAEGESTTSSGQGSHAEGCASTASGSYSHAEGSFTQASGDQSHTEGLSTQATHEAEHAQGKYNKSNSIEIHQPIEYVDLGLPSGLLWAKWNLGATSETEYGDYYAWGETEPKSSFTWSNYKWGDPNDGGFTKYNDIDGKTELEPEDDAAHVNLGGGWRMPTADEMQELIDNCQYAWVTDYEGSGVNGLYLLSYLNGVDLFIPAAGKIEGTDISSATVRSIIYLSTLKPQVSIQWAYTLYSEAGCCNLNDEERRHGLPIRPVISPSDLPKANTIHSTGIGTSVNDRKNAFEIMDNGSVFIKDIGNYDGTNPDTAVTLQDTVNNLITRGKVTISIVSSLPAVGDPNTIYFIPSSGNDYDEYIYDPDNNTWVNTRTVTLNLGDYYTKTETDNLLSTKADTIPVINETSGSTASLAIDPNKLYMFGEKTDITITLNAGVSSVVNEYMFQFTSGSTATTLNVPASITWMKEPDIQTNKTYQVSIINNLAIIGEW